MNYIHAHPELNIIAYDNNSTDSSISRQSTDHTLIIMLQGGPHAYVDWGGNVHVPIHDIQLRQNQLSAIRVAKIYSKGTVVVLGAPAQWGKTTLATYIRTHPELELAVVDEDELRGNSDSTLTTIIMKQDAIGSTQHAYIKYDLPVYTHLWAVRLA